MTMPDWSNWDSQKLVIEAEYKNRMDFFEWRDLGIVNKWISDATATFTAVFQLLF